MPQLSVSQVTLEFTYPTTNLKRINLQTSGEKWYYIDDSTRQILFFNANHSFWKTIDFPKEANKGVSLAPTNMPISQTIFKTDNLLELVWLFKDSTNKTERIKILNELNDSVYFFTEGYNKLTVNELAGSSTKLFVESRESDNVYQTIIFGLPNMVFEKSYPNASEMRRQRFGYAGEKLYFKNALLKRVEIFNPNYMPWKSIPLSFPSNGTSTYAVDPIFFADDKIFVADSLVEILFSYQLSSGFFVYNIISEDITKNDVLFVNSNSSFKFDHKVGQPDKIFHNYNRDLNTVNTQYRILSLPSYPVIVEHTYPFPVERVLFKQFGAKYTALRYNYIKLLNADHTDWKSFSLIPSLGYDFLYIYNQDSSPPQICDSIVNRDSLLEAIWIEKKRISNTSFDYQLLITNENQQKLATIPNSRLFEINKLDNLPTKLITKTWDSTRYTNTKVWRFDNTPTAVNNPSVFEGLKVNISPNPFNTSFSIHHSETERPLSIRLFNATGMPILSDKITSENATVTPESSLPNGIYFLEISNGVKRTVKRLVKI